MKDTIGSRIAAFRKEKNMTQEELAGKLGISSQAVSKWENDASCPDISTLPELCRILGITTDCLLTGKPDQIRVLPPQERRSMDDLTLRLKILSADGDKVRVNLPLSLVKLGMELGIDLSPQLSGKRAGALKAVDMGRIIEMVERGAIGKFVEMESAAGDTIEVVVE